MVHKRPFLEEDTFEVSNKQSKQAEHSDQWVLSSEPYFPEDAALISNASGEGRFTNTNAKCDEKYPNAFDTKHPGNSEVFETNVLSCIAISSLATCASGAEDSRPEEPLRLPSFAECFNSECHPVRTLVHLEDVYSILLECRPRKPVLVGPDHQADIPEWDSQVARNTSNDTDVSEIAANRYEFELMGTCIIPMPALESSAYDDNVGSGRTDCSCEDKNSVKCVRQHILEAREELRKSLGHERFVELGFCDMGELVAEKWSAEEQQLFLKIVFSNPVSSGRNFWPNLTSVFHYRIKYDIVSYYFNVFMLRKRSEQNRCESMSIDSDNDEWQGTDDSGNNEAGGFLDEDEDSAVESPACQEDFALHQNLENGLCVFDEDVAYKTCNNQSTDFASGADANKVAETCFGKLFTNCGSDPIAQVHEKTLKVTQEEEQREVQDESCTSSDTAAASQETLVNADNGDQWQDDLNRLNNGGSHGYVLEPCDTKGWDAGYPTCQKNKIDFLPTCSMIEEVFGDGS